MTDRELLELAAKAAGLELDKFSYTDRADLAQNSFTAKNYIGRWSPLTEDGDALRLAVKLVERQGEMLLAWINGGVEFGDTVMCYAQENQETDPYAATRRAIVHAAAEIGKGMK